MEFRILGSLYADAGTGSGPAVIRQPLPQSALAVLLLRANRPCQRDWLIDALWGSEAPASPEASLRVCISRLRRALGDCAVRLESVGPPGGRAPGHRQQRGYLMRVRPGELDVEEFADLAAHGQAQLDMGNPAAAAAALVQALALWADPALPHLPDTPIVRALASRLHDQRRAAIDALVDARLAVGEHEHVLGQLRAAAQADPSRERTAAQLMRAYRALDMRTEALEVYQRTRAALLAELGAEPGPLLVLLHKLILADLAADDPATQLARLPQAAPRQPAWQVPAPPPDFAGRANEIASIVDKLTGPGVPVAVIAGGPGTGKSATAAAAALKVREKFPDGQLYAELGGVAQPRDPQDVLADILCSLGVPSSRIPPAGQARETLYRSLLAGRHVLVVADDAATAAQVRPLIPGSSGAAVLVSSRSLLTGLAGASILELGQLPDSDALSLLGSAADAAESSAAHRDAATAVVAACGALPLALRVAGAVLVARPGLTVAGLARELEGGHVLDVLTAEDISVGDTIGSSYCAVSAAARRALALAATNLPADIPSWALAALADGDTSIATELVSVGLVSVATAEPGSSRYQMHPLTRAYAAKRGQQRSGQDREALTRMRASWLYRADRAAAQLPALPFLTAPPPLPAVSAQRTVDENPDWLQKERVNLRALTRYACDSGEIGVAIAFAARLLPAQCITGAYADAISMWRSIRSAAASAGDAIAEARASYYLGVALADSHEQLDEATHLLAACSPQLERAGDQAAAAMAYGLLARCASVAGRHAGALRSARRSLQVAQGEQASALTSCVVSAVLGVTLARVGLVESAEEHCRQAWRLAGSLGEPAYEAFAISALSQVLILSGQHLAALGLCSMGIGLARGYGSDVVAARFMLLEGRAQHCAGNTAAAIASLQSARKGFRAAGCAAEEITASTLLAACSDQSGDYQQAAADLDYLTQALTIRGIADSGNKALAARALAGLAVTALQTRASRPSS